MNILIIPAVIARRKIRKKMEEEEETRTSFVFTVRAEPGRIGIPVLP